MTKCKKVQAHRHTVCTPNSVWAANTLLLACPSTTILGVPKEVKRTEGRIVPSLDMVPKEKVPATKRLL